MTLKEEYFKVEQLFMEWFGTSYFENQEFPYSNKDVETIQHIIIPIMYKTFKKTSVTYNELVELCMNPEKSKKLSQKREEINLIYKEQLKFLIFITRFFLLLILEINGSLLIAENLGSYNDTLAMNLPVKIFHELLGSPGTKESIVFLIDLAFIQGNKLLVDQLYDYLTRFSTSIQYQCYKLREDMKHSIYRVFNHQLSSLTNNFDNSKYFSSISENAETMTIMFFKIRNLIRNLWMIDKSYKDLISWWQNFNLEFFKMVRRTDIKILYNQLNKNNLSELKILNFFDSSEYWELSTLCNLTAFVLYLTYISISQKDEKVIKTVILLQVQNNAYSINEIIREAIKFSLISIILDPANYKASWMLALLHLCNSDEFSLAYVYKFTSMTITLNPCFNDSWIVYSLLWTCIDRAELFELQDQKTIDLNIKDYFTPERIKSISPISAITKLISLNSNNENLKIPLKFIYISYNIYQILRDRENNDDLCYSLILEINELNQCIKTEIERVKNKNIELEKSVSISSTNTHKSKRNKEDAKIKEKECNLRKEQENLPLIINPIIFKLQMAFWSFKLKSFLNNDGFHMCCEFINSYIGDVLQLYNEYIESDYSILDELNIHSHVKAMINDYFENFSVTFKEREQYKDWFKRETEKSFFTNDQTRSIFEIEILDWKLLLTPIHYLY